ncbi:putative general secretion pathway protein F [Candidatus Protochlamydia naegleriophila]|uniref:General secretion pathway protein F n=1 Tax=Candidatus Protochlamydia naegleriophila TaxID=389348 RepID=A0A0U5J6Q4_9BACT|nr:type II secretion system F family protein [Candidatus Protochlamydia naegleriophila]CUI15737.1 putative general secretion pathway protein F [Candidatus Protochlamydia naegleriophila]
MPLYQYHYVDAQRKRRSGLIEALSEREAKDKLRDQGVLVTQIQTKAKVSSKQNLKGEGLLAFTVQLSQLVNAGVPLYESLTAIEEQSRGEPYHRIVLSLCEQIRTGMTLSAAMGTYPESFDKLYCGMVSAGEAVGMLGPVLEKLTQFLAKQMKLKKQITTAMIYPCILGGFSMLIIALLLGFVVPSLEGIFAERELNAFTNAVLAISHIFRDFWWLYIPAIVGGVSWGIWKFRSPEGKLWMEQYLLRLPLIKTLVIQTAVARFCRTMGTLLQGGLNMIESLRISRGVMRNVVLEKEIQVAEGKIIEGHSLSQELGKSRYIPQMVSRMLAVGEESGTSVTMLSRIADMYEQELEKTLDRVMALAQPVILIVMGLVIGTVLLAILLPLTDVSSFSVG